MLKHSIALLFAFALTAACANELRFTLRSDPKTFNPLLVEDDASETIRYLTGGVLIRLNRYTQELEGELASKWKVVRKRAPHRLRASAESSLLRRHAVYLPGRRVYSAAIDGPGGAFRGRRQFSFDARTCRSKMYGANFGYGAISRAGCGAGRSVRSGSDSVGAIDRARKPPCWDRSL